MNSCIIEEHKQQDFDGQQYKLCSTRAGSGGGGGEARRLDALGFFANSGKTAVRSAAILHTFLYILSAPLLKISVQGHVSSVQVTLPPKIFTVAPRLRF